MKQLYKRNAQGKPITWGYDILTNGDVELVYGLLGGQLHHEIINKHNLTKNGVNSLIKAKQKQGYKYLSEIRDNAPEQLVQSDLISYLNTYLPKYNTTDNGYILPMLAKTLEDDTPFRKGYYNGQYKINGLRCIVGAEKVDNDLFTPYRFTYTSREGTRWNLSWFDEVLKGNINKTLLDMMIEEGACLDGELYIPNQTVNNINSFVKNNTLKEHYRLQYWVYDICVENISASYRYNMLANGLLVPIKNIQTKQDHITNTDKLVLLPTAGVDTYNDAINLRNKYIDLGFEGLIIRNKANEYQFGKRNSSMYKFKKVYDGLFTIVDIIPEGKRINLPKFILQNDINDECFESTINLPQSEQEIYLNNKETFINKRAFVEYRERSGVNEVPFHAKIIKVLL